MLSLHVVERLYGVFILIKSAPADTGQPGSFPYGIRLSGLHHPLGLRDLHKDFRQRVCGHDIIFNRFRHSVHLLRSFVCLSW